MTRTPILYLNPRPLPLERDAELQAARDERLEPIVVCADASPYRAHGLEHIIETATGDYDAATRAILGYTIEHGLDVAGVVAWCDLEVELVARVGAALGVPASSMAAAENVRNKANTRRLLNHVPGANPRHVFLRDASELERALEEVGIPCLLKPAGSSGARGIHEIGSRAEAADVFRAFREYCDPRNNPIFGHHAREFIVEERLSGSEHSIAGMVSGGEISIFAITDKRVDRSLFLTYQTTTPSRLPEHLQAEMKSMARAAVARCGIESCGFHVDMMVTADGPKILEIGGRLGGECINSHLIPLAMPGLAPYRMLLRVACGRPAGLVRDDRAEIAHKAGLRLLLPPRPGRIARIEGMERVHADARVRHVVVQRQVGDQLVPPRERFDHYAIGCFIAVCDLDQDIDAVLDEIASFVHVDVDDAC